MILWIILFLLIIGISFVLALRSMKDYQEIPETKKTEYALFLIRKTGFNGSSLNLIGKRILDEGLIISIERLFKGKQAALTIFGPKKILNEFISELNLLELEDYTSSLDNQGLSVWELGVKSAVQPSLDNPDNIFNNLPELPDTDQFFWQVVLGVKMVKKELSFQTQIRAGIFCKDPLRKKVLVPLFQNLKFGELTYVPRPFSAEQMAGFFKSRTLSKDSAGPILNSSGVMRLLKV